MPDDRSGDGDPMSATELASTLRRAGCVFAEAEADLLLAEFRSNPAADPAALIAARVAGHPLEHVLGWAAFAGLRIRVGPGVFVPRRRSEWLVQTVCAALAAGAVPGDRRPVVLDLCCGTGAIGAAIATRLGVELHAADLDPVALHWARVNLAGIGTVWAGDLFGALPRDLAETVDLVVASAPYVPSDAIDFLPPEAREHEPRIALDGGHDGLAIYRRLVAELPGWLAPGGRLALETSEDQAVEAARLVADAGLAVQVCTDGWGSTVVLGRLGADRVARP